MQKAVFLGFGGVPITQSSTRLVIAPGFECWDLKKMTLPQFVIEIKSAIPPLNVNIMDAFYFGDSRFVPPMEPIYKRCSWGLLLPFPTDKHGNNNVEEVLFILNLFSPAFLNPHFSTSDMGMRDHSRDLPEYWHEPSYTQDQSSLFKTDRFVKFFHALEPACPLFSYDYHRIRGWREEKHALAMACALFKDLRHYISKDTLKIHREYLDIRIILEMLLTYEDEPAKGPNVLNRMMTFLKGIRKNSKYVYKYRNDYVHGKTFKYVKYMSTTSQTKGRTGKYYDHHFKVKDKAKKFLRYLLAACIQLFINKQADVFLKKLSNLQIIDRSAGDLYLKKGKRSPDKVLRRKLRTSANSLFRLMPG